MLDWEHLEGGPRTRVNMGKTNSTNIYCGVSRVPKRYINGRRLSGSNKIFSCNQYYIGPPDAIGIRYVLFVTIKNLVPSADAVESPIALFSIRFSDRSNT